MILAGTQILASHPIITAVPFFVPTFAVLAVVGVIVYRDRRRPKDEDADDGTGADGTGGSGGVADGADLADGAAPAGAEDTAAGSAAEDPTGHRGTTAPGSPATTRDPADG